MLNASVLRKELCFSIEVWGPALHACLPAETDCHTHSHLHSGNAVIMTSSKEACKCYSSSLSVCFYFTACVDLFFCVFLKCLWVCNDVYHVLKPGVNCCHLRPTDIICTVSMLTHTHTHTHTHTQSSSRCLPCQERKARSCPCACVSEWYVYCASVVVHKHRWVWVDKVYQLRARCRRQPVMWRERVCARVCVCVLMTLSSFQKHTHTLKHLVVLSFKRTLLDIMHSLAS